MNMLLDTNVLSEILRSSPDPQVLAWFSRQADQALFVSAITQAEMLLGASLLPPGRRRERLQGALTTLFEVDFAGRVLPFDELAVSHFVDAVVARGRSGRPISQFDAQIAAIALNRNLAVATRNTRDFEGRGLRLVDPWA